MAVPLRVYTEPSLPIDSTRPSAQQVPTLHVHQVQGVADLYMDHLHARVLAGDYSEDSLDCALRELRNFIKHFGNLAICECRQHDLTRWLGLNPQWKSSGKKKRAVSTILACLRWAADEELISHCPYRWPNLLKGLPDKVRRPAEAIEYISLMRFGSRPLRQALFLMRRLGIRTKEMRKLVWTDIELGVMPHICLDKHKTRKKTGKARKIGLDNATANFLRAMHRNQRGCADPHVFKNSAGTPWARRTFAQHLRRYAERIGLDDGVDERISAGCIRHTYVSDGIEGGVTTRRIADQTGHIRTDMIDTVYGSHTRERVEHLDEVATEILRKRRRTKCRKTSDREGFQQPSLFDSPGEESLSE